ncbi:MAG: LA2681 family HEPN domain-containing protein [Candidatus Eisenbacteria bacterium]|nr:LA2681 family HEPN domain-containing protein [Candidatus Eisenbacteria bacterium]
MQARAFTNLGNALNRANRWVEAYDSYLKALELDRTNAVASTGAAKVLLRSIDRGIGKKEDLQAAASKHLKESRIHEARLRELTGEQAYQHLRKILDLDLDVPERQSKSVSEYERFVAKNRLALAPTIEGLDVSPKRWDALRIHSLIEPADKGGGIPPLFAMFNVLKGEYLLARRMAFDADNCEINDSGSYSDTLDYAVYGVRPSMLISAQRMCMDILDKIAIAVTEYLGLKDHKRSISFRNRWFSRKSGKSKERIWHADIRESLMRGNLVVVAMAEMALDLSGEGFLFEKKLFRDAGTHGYTVLHDLGADPSRPSDYVEHCSLVSFSHVMIDSLRLARAAIIYFVELVALEERLKRNGTKTVALDVPDYHWIRGEDCG